MSSKQVESEDLSSLLAAEIHSDNSNLFRLHQTITVSPHAVSFSLHRCLYPRETWNSVLQPPAVYKCSKTFQASFSKLMYSFRCDQKWHFGRAKRILKRGQSPQTSMCTHTLTWTHTHTHIHSQTLKKKYNYILYRCMYLFVSVYS